MPQSKPALGRLRVGCAGFSNKAWVGDALPAGTPRDGPSMLDAYQGRFDFVEVNSTFYGCPDPHAVANSVTRWAARCAPGFEMGLKAPRTITHEGRLAEPAALAALRRFLEVAASLGDALGPLLLQFPRSLTADIGDLEALDGVVRGSGVRRVALEFRHPSWISCPKVADFMRTRDWAMVQHPNSLGRATTRPSESQSAGPPERAVTGLAPLRDEPGEPRSMWEYVRLHGDNDEHSYDYTAEELAPYASTVAAWRAAGRDVYVAFLNESGPTSRAGGGPAGCAMPKNAAAFRAQVHAINGDAPPRPPKAPTRTMLSFFRPAGAAQKRQRADKDEGDGGAAKVTRDAAS